jgi:hypothetical protein
MILLPGTVQIVGDVDTTIGKSGTPIRVYSIEVIGAGSATTVKLYNSTTTTANTNYAQVDADAASSTVQNYSGGKLFPNGCYCQTDANTAFITICYTQDV